MIRLGASQRQVSCLGPLDMPMLCGLLSDFCTVANLRRKQSRLCPSSAYHMEVIWSGVYQPGGSQGCGAETERSTRQADTARYRGYRYTARENAT